MHFKTSSQCLLWRWTISAHTVWIWTLSMFLNALRPRPTILFVPPDFGSIFRCECCCFVCRFVVVFCLQVACVVVIIVIAISLLFCKQSALFLSKTLYHLLYRIHNPDPLIKSLTMDTGSIVADLKRNKNAFKSSLINERVSCWCV